MIMAAIVMLAAGQLQTLPSRIVGETQAPVELVAEPCAADESARIIARRVESTSPTEALFGQFQSQPFECPGANCLLGVRTQGKTIASFKIGAIILRNQATFASWTTPDVAVRTVASCNGMPLIKMPMTLPEDTEGVLYYIAGVSFADGSMWQVDDRLNLVESVTREWRKRKR